MNILTDEQYNHIVTLYNWLKEDKDITDAIHIYKKSVCLFQIRKVMETKKYTDIERKLLNYIVKEYNKCKFIHLSIRVENSVDS